MRGVIEEARQIVREMPGFVAAFLLLVALCIGVRGAVFYEADGEGLKLITDGDHRGPGEEMDAINRMRAHAGCSLKTPGFTVIVGVRQYGMELSVPARSVQTFFKGARPNAIGAVALKLDSTI